MDLWVRASSLSDMGKLDSDDARAPYLRVAERVLEAVVEGAYQPGERLPALPTLAEEFGVAVGTVRSALAVLRDKGIIDTRHGAGTFIRSDLDIERLQGGAVWDGGVGAELAEIRTLLVQINDRLARVEQRMLGT